MKTFDGNPAKPGASPIAKPKDDKTILDAEAATPPQPTKNPLPVAVSNLTTIKTIEKNARQPGRNSTGTHRTAAGHRDGIGKRNAGPQ
jgi:hypothetical protein